MCDYHGGPNENSDIDISSDYKFNWMWDWKKCEIWSVQIGSNVHIWN